MLAAGAGPGTGPAASNILTVPVYVLDNSVRNIQIDINATVGDAVLAMGAALGIKNTAKLAPLFALCDCVDGINIGRPLSPAMPIAEVIASWPVPSPSVEDGGHPGAGADASSSAGGSQAEPRFVFQLKLFTEGLTIGCSIDPKVMYLQWVQAVYNVVCGFYPVTVDEAISLAALQVQTKFGTHNSEVHKSGFLLPALRGLIPASLQSRKSAEDWESLILSRHYVLNLEAQARPMAVYCAALASKEYYGCAFYTVKQRFSQDLSDKLVVAVSGRGIYLLDSDSRQPVGWYPFAQIMRWGYEPDSSFYFQAKNERGQPGPSYEFQTTGGHYMSQLLTDYATQMLEEMKQKQSAPAARPVSMSDIGVAAPDSGGGGGDAGGQA